jgi:hypothetical protein
LEPRTDALKTAPDSRSLTGPADAPHDPAPVRRPWSRPAFTLRILHLSDLPEGQPGQEALWRRRRILGEAWLKNLELIAGAGGRLIWCASPGMWPSGRREEYVRAADFVRELLRRLDFGPERFFAVPANRDMDRKIEVAAWRALRDQIGPRDAEDLSE